MDTKEGRALPHSSEAERVIVGGIEIDNSLIAEAIDIVAPDDFYVPAYKHIYAAEIELFKQGKEITPPHIEQQLILSGQLGKVGTINELWALMDAMPAVDSLQSYATLVREKSMLRQLRKAVNKIESEISEEGEEARIILDNANKYIFDISVKHSSKTFSTLGTLIHSNIDKAHTIQQQMHDTGHALTGITTGFDDLDSLTLGLQKSDFIVLAARPSMGKTALATQFAVSAAKVGHCVAFFSLEMPEDQIAMRVVCGEAKVESQKYRQGYTSTEEWGRIHEAEVMLNGLRLYVDDTPAISVAQLKAKAMRLAAELASTGSVLAMIVVDYIQLMEDDSGDKYESRQQTVTKISRNLKSVARELMLPLVALSQLSRAPENRTDHRPVLADLRESGAIEQDADVVAFIYRDDQYKPKTEQKDNMAEIILAKHRNGPTDTKYLRFDDQFARFDNLYNH